MDSEPEWLQKQDAKSSPGDAPRAEKESPPDKTHPQQHNNDNPVTDSARVSRVKTPHTSGIAPAPNTGTCPVPVRRMLRRKQFLAAAAGYSIRRRNIVVQAHWPERRPGGFPAPPNQHSSAPMDIHFGLTATRKTGKAVIRNRARRRMRHAARIYLPDLGVRGGSYVFIARRNTASCTWNDLTGDIRSALAHLRRKLDAEIGRNTCEQPEGARRKKKLD